MSQLKQISHCGTCGAVTRLVRIPGAWTTTYDDDEISVCSSNHEHNVAPRVSLQDLQVAHNAVSVAKAHRQEEAAIGAMRSFAKLIADADDEMLGVFLQRHILNLRRG